MRDIADPIQRAIDKQLTGFLDLTRPRNIEGLFADAIDQTIVIRVLESTSYF